MIQQAIKKLTDGDSLTEEEAGAAMASIMEGTATPSQIAAFLVALRMKGETVAEITGLARAMREKAVRVEVTRRPLVDTCGTGGAVMKTFNISTTAAFVAAAAGVVVAKHGNRAATSICGSADVLEALGVHLTVGPEVVARCIDTVGIGFLFARSYHPAMRHAAPVRSELGIRTVFNTLGPLTNPAGATRQVIGVYDSSLCRPLAEALMRLGAEHVLVVHGMRGLDEISTWEETIIAEGRDGRVTTYLVGPEDLGLTPAKPEEVTGGCDARDGARILLDILEGKDRGPRRDIVLANAAAALVVGGVSATLREGVTVAADCLDSGAARRKVDELVAFAREVQS
ncbi:MAG: anthranilate phosphoribosyltransferase [Capsulimonadales bacterium]|nr:anthranilate phosphoribosyltransferase [Capsulimonadales bacterium]